MNQLSVKRRVQLLRCLVDGNGINGTARICSISRNTVFKFMKDMGYQAEFYHNWYVNQIRCTDIQCDELSSFVGGRKKAIGEYGRARKWGECYTWIAIEPKTKLLVAWRTGGRTRSDAKAFLEDLALRVEGKVRISTDAYASYKPEIADAFGCSALHRVYRKGDNHKWTIGGGKVHTSFVERMNLTIRQSVKRFARRTTAFSKSHAGHQASLAIFFLYYNFVRIHRSLRISPAMAAGLSKHLWSLEDMVYLLYQRIPQPKAKIIPFPKRELVKLKLVANA